LQSARAEIEALSARHGWTAHQNAGFVEEASRALSVVRRSLPGMLGQEALDFYAKTSAQGKAGKGKGTKGKGCSKC